MFVSRFWNTACSFETQVLPLQWYDKRQMGEHILRASRRLRDSQYSWVTESGLKKKKK